MPSAWWCVRAPAALSTGWEARCLLSPVLSQQGSCSWPKHAMSGRPVEAAELFLGSWCGTPGVWHPLGSGALQPRALTGLGALVPVCAQAAALQLGASLWLRDLPRMSCSAGAWLAHPLKRRKILLSAHSARSMKPQSIQQQPSVVCCPQPPAASMPARTGRSPPLDITSTSPGPRQSSRIRLSWQCHFGSILHWGAKDGCGGCGLTPIPLRRELRLPLQPTKPHVIRAGKV